MSHQPRLKRQLPLSLDRLEERAVPANFVVNSLLDNALDDGLTTLREAITAANANSEADVISFAPLLFLNGDAEITLTKALPGLGGELEVNGPRNYVDATGYYLSDTMSVGDFVATAGVRFDDVTNAVENGATQKDDAASVSFGLLYRGPAGISPYASYAESFQPLIGVDTITNQQRSF